MLWSKKHNAQTDFAVRLNNRLREIPKQPAPAPWHQVGSLAVGGLTEVGFLPNSDLLLIVSAQGRGLLDCQTGERVARDKTPPHEGSWYECVALKAKGIGNEIQESVTLAGLHGGGLRHFTEDGWHLECIAPDWPKQAVVLTPKGASILAERFTEGCVKLTEDAELRTFGFSETGKSFVVAYSSDLHIYARE